MGERSASTPLGVAQVFVALDDSAHEDSAGEAKVVKAREGVRPFGGRVLRRKGAVTCDRSFQPHLRQKGHCADSDFCDLRIQTVGVRPCFHWMPQAARITPEEFEGGLARTDDSLKMVPSFLEAEMLDGNLDGRPTCYVVGERKRLAKPLASC